ncbi:imidazoleglycerol-phosphate dehydratase HisB [Isachenkonia alkalipeptolytica]|uniref:Imidazoleglycerol-phosphate dehydratase n=1 Tax=Isachenkonia alkalipeptolytica TaxID=2565777 RepID=A0AA43XIP4_9CLOT|nr:imidazoleglycerol-phosphate dehydratase HisB [Isachenkonia alkalipeptolytica]NBG87513.1 imidazoleglycerol-phosphate dehydratase HisB [Isachenkonia alkalipeptolytica]
MREASITRETTETKIHLILNLDGEGTGNITTGSGFFDHMLHLFTAHSGIDLTLKAAGDLAVDAHHTVEDVGICLGEAFRQALGDKAGIRRYGFFYLPMDEALVRISLDFSGRAYLAYDLRELKEKVGDFDTELIEEFYQGFVRGAGLTLHIDQIRGRNTHHIIEASFKGFGRAIREAVTVTGTKIPSTKGSLD